MPEILTTEITATRFFNGVHYASCLMIDDPVQLVRVPENQKDPNAIRVELDTGEQLGYIERTRGRSLAMRAVRKIDTVFMPRKLNPDDAKVIFHPVDYVVFKGMKDQDEIKKIVILDRKDPGKSNRTVQKSVEKAVEKGRYEWQTLRVGEDGGIEKE